jgi:hypothetical protein
MEAWVAAQRAAMDETWAQIQVQRARTTQLRAQARSARADVARLVRWSTYLVEETQALVRAPVALRWPEPPRLTWGERLTEEVTRTVLARYPWLSSDQAPTGPPPKRQRAKPAQKEVA